jgi:Spy/CpxP family protein refolding chaperone
MKILGIDLRTEMEKEKIDMAKVTELADKIGKLRAEQAKSRILHAAQVASVMTKEQRDQLEKLRAERRQQMMERFHQNPGKPMKPRK